MNKKILILIFTFFLIACSNKSVQNNFSDEVKNSLTEFSLKIKENLSLNNYEYLKENTDKSIRNNLILAEIEKIDFSAVNIFMSKVVFTDENPTSILALNVGDNTLYFELNYIYNYHSRKWFINKVKERR